MTAQISEDNEQIDCGLQDHAAPARRSQVPTDATFERAAGLFRAAGDTARLRLLDQLRDGERCVTELASAVGAKMSTVSQQLRLLREEDLIVSRRAGKHIWYALADQHVISLIQNVLDHTDQEHCHSTPQNKEQPIMANTHEVHENHTHVHSEHCGHTRIQHDGHVDYLHDGHLHSPHEGHYDEHVLKVSATNPTECKPVACACGHTDCGHEQVRHGDHMDFVYEGRLHHKHGDHCDDHGLVSVVH